MSTDIKAATEIAERNKNANTTFGTLAAAFIELQAELNQERKAREKVDQFAAEETLRCLEAEQRAAELQARLERVEAHAEALAFALDGMSADTNTALPQAWHDYRQRALAAAGGQTESAAAGITLQQARQQAIDILTRAESARTEAADPALPGLELTAKIAHKSAFSENIPADEFERGFEDGAKYAAAAIRAEIAKRTKC